MDCFRCQTCRKRKTRCSGERPSCDTCLQTGQTCLGYSESGQQERDPGSLNPTLKTETTPRRPGHEQYSSSPEHPGHIQTSEQRDRMSDHSSHTAATSTSGGRTSDASLSQLSQASDPSYAFLSSEHFFAPHGPIDGGTDLDTKSTFSLSRGYTQIRTLAVDRFFLIHSFASNRLTLLFSRYATDCWIWGRIFALSLL